MKRKAHLVCTCLLLSTILVACGSTEDTPVSTSTPEAPTEAAASTGSGRIAFGSDRDGNYEIYVMNMDGSDQRNVTRSVGMNEKSSTWLGDGTVVYVREERVDRSATWVVARQALDGEAETLTQPTLVVTDFAISPSGDVLAVTTESPGPTGGVARRLFLIPLDGETPVEVPRAGEHDQLVRPAFRP